MNLGSLLGTSATELGLRFNLVGIFPSTTLVIFILTLIWSGAPGSEPQLSIVIETIKELETTESLFLIFIVIALSLIMQPLQLSLVRILEGYWGGSRLGIFLSQKGIDIQKQRRRKLDDCQRIPPLSNKEIDRVKMAIHAAKQLSKSYPSEDRLLPTAFGNVLRAAEGVPERQYGLDAVVLWPRLYPLLPGEMKRILADRRNQLDMAVRFCAVFLLAAIISTAFLFRYGFWLIIPVLNIVLAWLSYQAAISAAFAYGESIVASFDLHRFDLLKALHLPLPSNRDTEKENGKILSDFLRQGASEEGSTNFQYMHQ